MSRFVEIVLSVLPGCEIARGLEPQLVACVARAVTAWPAVNLDGELFVLAIAKRLTADSIAGSLETMRTNDLYLATGCAMTAPGAAQAFEASFGPVIARAIASTCLSNAERADLGQIVRQRLLVNGVNGGAPRIATYSGRGSLQAWVRVVATREVARMLASAHREIPTGDDVLAKLIGADEDPELAYLKRLYREEFTKAFHTAADALDARARLLIRQSALDGLSIDQLSALHGVHRATAARWVEAARRTLLASTQRQMIQRLRLSRAELASVMHLIGSQLDVTLSSALEIEHGSR